MYGHDVRRTNRATLRGPTTYTKTSARNWTYPCRSAGVLNMQPAVGAAGVYFGSWGLLRRDVTQTPDRWVKSDGKYYGLQLTAQPSAAAQEIFAPFDPSPVPVGYLLSGRTKLPRDVQWCGSNNAYLVSFYNGTIEGTAAIDPRSGAHYVGRGDGVLYAIDPVRGRVLWQFRTFNPKLPNDPDGGGEVVGGPLLGPDGHLYFGTFAAPWPGTASEPAYETNAVYSVTTTGQLRWRYPSQDASLENIVLAPLAVDRSGKTLYAATWAGDTGKAGRLLALDLTQPPNASDSQRLKWSLDLVNPAHPLRPSIWAFRIAVDLEGTIYVAGAEAHLFGSSPVLTAVRDLGSTAAFAWNPAVVEPQGYPSTAGQIGAGVALFEVADRPHRIYFSTTHSRVVNGVGGALFAIDPRTGTVLGSFDPSTLPQPGVGGMTGPIVDDDDVVYVGIRGKHDLLFPTNFVNGWMYGVRFDSVRGTFQVLLACEVDGNLDWCSPAIGPSGGLYFCSADRFSPIEQAKWFGLTEAPPRTDPKAYAIFE
ncbi:MAG: PQQ-like beta-propeller repeat protein [Planctomycetes bacterium]|nr:PQQ-like beta-propeller repeat protein [Planctomycetota bacterium]